MQGVGVVVISVLILAKNVHLPPELRGFIFYAQVRALDDCIIIYNYFHNAIYGVGDTGVYIKAIMLFITCCGSFCR